MNKNGNIILIVFLSICVFLLIGVLVSAILFGGNIWDFGDGFGKYELMKEETYGITDLDNIKVSLLSSDVVVKESQSNEVVIRQYSTRDMKEDKKFVSSMDNKVLNVSERKNRNFLVFSFGFYLDNYIEISIPKDYQKTLYVKTVSGDIDIRKSLILTDLTFKTTSGDIKSKVSLESEKLDISSVSGEVKLSDINADKTTIKTTSGDIELGKVNSLLNIKTVSGETEIDSLDGNIELSSTSGDVSVDLFLMKEKSKIKTVSGEINIKINKKSNVEIQSKSVSGDISLPNNSSIIGTSPFKTLELKTTSGDIKIIKAS